jgi:hypothetical protein
VALHFGHNGVPWDLNPITWFPLSSRPFPAVWNALVFGEQRSHRFTQVIYRVAGSGLKPMNIC